MSTASPAIAGVRIAQLSTDDLAAHVRRTPGVHRAGHTFARTAAQRPGKDRARSRVLKLFTDGWTDWLSVVTLPGLDWRFERELLAARERDATLAIGWPKKTRIVGIEEDEAIYRASFSRIPGGERILQVEGNDFATANFRTRLVHRYHRCRFEDFAALDERIVDAAWLDFTGPVRDARADALRSFWPRVSSLLVVTAQAGRTPFRPEDFTTLLSGCELIDVYRYRDTCGMWQATIGRADTLRTARARALLAACDARHAAKDARAAREVD